MQGINQGLWLPPVQALEAASTKEISICVLFSSQLLATPSTVLSMSTFPSPTLPAPTRSSSGSSLPPIAPSDLLLALGIYAFGPALPTVIGNEAVGRVLAVGPGVEK